MADMMAAMPRVKLEEPVERSGPVIRMDGVAREVGLAHGVEHHVPALVEAVENLQ